MTHAARTGAPAACRELKLELHYFPCTAKGCRLLTAYGTCVEHSEPPELRRIRSPKWERALQKAA